MLLKETIDNIPQQTIVEQWVDGHLDEIREKMFRTYSNCKLLEDNIEESDEPRDRLLCEMEICSSMLLIPLPPGFRVVRRGEIKTLKESTTSETKPHIFAKSGDNILCFTVGQFHDVQFGNDGNLKSGDRINTYKQIAPGLIFHTKDKEVSYLFGPRPEISRLLHLNYISP